MIKKNFLKGKLRTFQQQPRIFPAVLGNTAGNVQVSGRPNYVWVRIPGQPVTQIFNNKVAPELDLPVIVGYDVTDPTRFQVLGIRTSAGKFGGSTDKTVFAVPAHHKTHEWMAVGGGDDIVFTQLRQFMPLRPTPIGGMELHVYRNVGFVNNQWMMVSGQSLDLTDAIPWTGAYFGLLYVDTDGTLDMLTGTIKSIATLRPSDIPLPLPNTYPIAGVRLYGGQTGLFESRMDTDLIDLRLFNVPNQGTGSSGSGGGHIIQDEGTPLTQRSKLNVTGQYVAAIDDSVNGATIIGVDDTRWVDINRMGFMITPETTISFDPATYTFTLAKTGSSWRYMRSGIVRTISANKTVTLPGSPPSKATYYIYIDADDGSLTASTVVWSLQDAKIPVAIILWDNALTPKYQMMDERHTVAIDRRMHQFIHESEGCHYVSGGLPTGITLNTDTNAAICYGISPCTIDDEDLKWTLSELLEPTGATGTYTVMYRNGAASYDWKTSNMPYSYTTGGYIDYDNGGTLTQGQNAKYYNYYLIATNISGQARFIVMPGRGEFSTQAAAVAESPFNFDWSGFPLPEVVILYQITYYGLVSHSSTGRVKEMEVPKRIITSVVSISSVGGGLDGHRILDSSATPMTQRGNLQFSGDVVVTDDAGNNTTLVTITASGTSPGHTIEDEGTPMTQRSKLDFRGATVFVVDDPGSGATQVIISGSSGGHIIEDEGSPMGARPNLNFVGGTVFVVDNPGNNSTDIIISGSTSGGTLSGLGVNKQVAFWTGSSSLGGDAEFTFETGTVSLRKYMKAGGLYSKMSTDINVVVEAGYSWIVSSGYEIAAGMELEIQSGAVMEII